MLGKEELVQQGVKVWVIIASDRHYALVSFPCLPTMFRVMDQKLDSGKAWEQGYHILNVVLLTASVRTGEQRFPSHDEAPLFSM